MTTLLIALLILLAVASVLLLQWRKAELAHRAHTARMQLLHQLTQRFADSEDFILFANSPEGRLVLGAPDTRVQIARRLLLMAQVAVLLVALGIGFLATAVMTPANADINLLRAAEEAQWWGTMCLALGAGFGLAFWFSQRRARTWGLLAS